MSKAKKILSVVLVAIGTCASSFAAASAQTYPQSSIRIIVPYSAGGSTDILARILAKSLSPRLGQSVVVINQPGAGGIIGTEAAANSEPNGYTLLMATNGMLSINPSLYSKLPYDAAKDFVPISLVATVPLLLVVPEKAEMATLQELMDQYSNGQVRVNFGSAGIGASGHLAGEMLKLEGKMDATHVPYKGDAPAVVDLMADRIDYLFANMPAAANQVRAGSIRALAVTTAERSSGLPDVPTVAEAGFPTLQVDPWYGLLVPAGTSPEIVKKLQAAINAALEEPSIRKQFENLGATPQGTSSKEFAEVISSDTKKFEKIIRISGARAD